MEYNNNSLCLIFLANRVFYLDQPHHSQYNTIANNLNEIVNEINGISISDKSDTEEFEDDYEICEECGNENTGEDLCLLCNSQHFQQNFGNWTSGNKDFDAIILESQSNCTTNLAFVE
ncbi:hypothetical protein Glove_79g72 [Diversispora epigaea]|uniref:Uncharacterized protein n=1 Tax=Diversispora epigaea TaxID=1348612 RepID=A0A397JBT8_9GLOM|nr:hypothetical protein Glove_79g72 [Diversispora epigaea]